MGLAGDLAPTWAIIRRELMGPSHQTVLSQCWRKNNINLYVERYDHWHKFLNACIIMYISIQYVYHCISLYYSMKSQWTHKPQVPKSKHPQPFGHFRLNHRLAPGLAFEFDCVCDGVDFTLRAWKHLEPLKGGLTGGTGWYPLVI